MKKKKGIIKLVNGITVNFFGFACEANDNYLEGLVSDFNEYSNNNNLDIDVHKILISSANSTTSIDEYSNSIEALLNKGSDKYDLLMINSLYVNHLRDFIAELDKYVSKDIIDKYIKGVTSKIGFIDDKLLAIVYIYNYYYN